MTPEVRYFGNIVLVYQILHKPTEVFALIPGESNKAPIETWRQYAPLFREYSTASISPELLAALAQVESAGNPIARTYWRWSLTSDPFAVYQPASSAVGMYQMTDAALSEAQGYCILHHSVVETGCSATLLHSRVVPRHATELTAVFLDRNLAAILGHGRKTKFGRQQREEIIEPLNDLSTGARTRAELLYFRVSSRPSNPVASPASGPSPRSGSIAHEQHPVVTAPIALPVRRRYPAGNTHTLPMAPSASTSAAKTQILRHAGTGPTPRSPTKITDPATHSSRQFRPRAAKSRRTSP